MVVENVEIEPEDRRTHLRRTEDLQLLQYRTRNSEIAIKEMRVSVSGIEKALVALVSYEGRMQTLSAQVQGVLNYQDLLRAVHLEQEKWITQVQATITDIDKKLPMLMAVKTWVINAGLGVLALVGAGVVALVLKQ